MTFTKQQLDEVLARNKDLARRNQIGGQTQVAEPEPIIQHEPLAQVIGKEAHAGRISISVTSFRRRLCDPDNICPKYFIDCLRYAEIIEDDTAEHITLQVSQEKVKTKGEERTELLITKL